MRIRHYEKGDLDTCRSLWAGMLERHREMYEDPSIGGDDPGREFDAHLKRIGPDLIWLAEVEGEVVGFTSLIVEEEQAEIEPIIVAQTHRGKGIGERLIQRAVEEATEQADIRLENFR